MSKIIKKLILCSSVLWISNITMSSDDLPSDPDPPSGIECKGKCTEVKECPKPAPGHANCDTGTTQALCEAITLTSCTTGEYKKCDGTTEEVCREDVESPYGPGVLPRLGLGPCGTGGTFASNCLWIEETGTCEEIGDAEPLLCLEDSHCVEDEGE